MEDSFSATQDFEAKLVCKFPSGGQSGTYLEKSIIYIYYMRM